MIMTDRASLTPNIPDEASLPELPELADASAWFAAFVAPYRAGTACPPLELKVRHTWAVTRAAHRIVDSLTSRLSRPVRRAALLAALLHDVGRFPQFHRWQTFRDADSANHGTLGARVLAGNRDSLRGEDRAVRRLVIGAVALHNRYRLPADLCEPLATVTNIVRDADKIDILRIFAKELRTPDPSPDVVLHVAREPEKWSPHIVDMVLQGQMPDYRDLRYVNDFVMLLCFWPTTLNFVASREMVRDEGTITALLAALPDAAQLEPIRTLARAALANPAERSAGESCKS